MKVPRVLRAGDFWLETDNNRENLRGLLDAYQINLDQVYEIHFDRRSMEVYRFKTTSEGMPYAENGGAAREPALRVSYRAGLTPEVAG